MSDQLPSQPYLEKWDRQIVEAHARTDNLAMMLRRMIWQIEKMQGDTDLKVLAGKASVLLKRYGLDGSPMRAVPSTQPKER
jgi:hypothetical protein